MERAWPMALLFLAFVALSQGQKTTPAPETEVAVERGARLVVECALRPEQRAVWRKDGAAPPPDMRADETRRDGALRARLSAARAAQHHAGLYECAPDSPRLRVRLTGTEPAAPTTAAAVAATAAPESAERLGGLLLLYHHKEFSLYCNDLASSDPTATIVWSINGTALENKPELRARVLVETVDAVERGRLRVKAANFDDWGNYSCSVGGQERTWQLHAKLSARLPADTSVVEGQKLKLACKVIGYPATGVVWSYSNQSDNISLSLPVAEVFAERVSLRPNEFGVRDAELSINVTQRSDAGWFFCAPDNSELSSVSRLRVKDMYAALWPFLGICAEVFVLCAIILVYEKRRTKPELDDSDTDNHDQKKS